jgi:hypothetical protein
MRIWSVERDGIYFLLSDDSPQFIGDYFVYLNPTNDNHVLFNNETLKFNMIKVAKLVFYYDRQKRYLSQLMDNHIVNKITKFDY